MKKNTWLAIFVFFLAVCSIASGSTSGQGSYGNNLKPADVASSLEKAQSLPDTLSLKSADPDILEPYALPTPKPPGPVAQLFTDIKAILPGAHFSDVVWGDYDNDGHLDFLLTGYIGEGPVVAKIFHNNADGRFSDIHAELAGVLSGSVAWGDYDNDGDLDILLTGETGTFPTYFPISRIYQNNGDGMFSLLNTSLLGLTHSSASFGDYDNDGDLDILLTGDKRINNQWTFFTKIYRNDLGPDNTRTFTDINVNLPAVSFGNSAFGDYDNDGDLDILLTGQSSSGCISKIYRNNGNGTFADINANLIGVCYSSAAWGDYDNDGDLDVALTGNTDSGMTSKIYRNNGAGMFMDTFAGIPGYRDGHVAWGDYDNDGDLDLLLAGWNASGSFCKVYRNNGNDLFDDISAGLPGIMNGQAVWGDYNKDGRLDILLTGWNTSLGLISKVYRNNGKSFGYSKNTPPIMPKSLQAAAGNRTVTLSWGRALDMQTPQNGLSYNLYIGKTAHDTSTVSPMSDLHSGFRRLAALGSQNENTSWVVQDLAPGTYNWGVQAVDSGFMGSVFATGTFTLGSVTLPGPRPALTE